MSSAKFSFGHILDLDDSAAFDVRAEVVGVVDGLIRYELYCDDAVDVPTRVMSSESRSVRFFLSPCSYDDGGVHTVKVVAIQEGRSGVGSGVVDVPEEPVKNCGGHAETPKKIKPLPENINTQNVATR